MLSRGIRAVPLVVVAAGVTLAPHAAIPVESAERRIEVTASRFEYEPDRIDVDEGDHVTLVIHSKDTSHGLRIRQFGVNAKIPKDGSEVVVDFVADKVGEFPFSCSVYCGSGHRSMRGLLVVNARTE